VTDPTASFPPSSVGWTRPRVIFLALSAAFCVILLVAVREVLRPFVLALILAYVLTPLVARCERLRIPRAVSILLVYFVTIGILYVAIAAMAPRLYRETLRLAQDAPQMANEAAKNLGPKIDAWTKGFLDRQRAAAPPGEKPALEIRKQKDGSFAVDLGSGVEIVQDSPQRWRVIPAGSEQRSFRVSELLDAAALKAVHYVSLNALEVIKLGQTLIAGLSRGIFLVFMTLMLAGYMMHTREKIRDFFVSLPPPRARASFDRLLFRMDRGLSGVVRGQLLICGVNGVLSAIGFWIFDLKYWPILAVVAAVMSLIPIFGSILSSIPAVLIGLTQDFFTALWVLLWIVGIHQIEANLLNPKIIGVAAKIHPVLVVFALIVGEHFFGLWGALLAVPSLSLVQSVFNHFRFDTMPDVPPDSLLPPVAVGRRPQA
jgi:predicted PurR-regulated permease PerM